MNKATMESLNGSVGKRLYHNNWQLGVLRPYIDPKTGQSFYTNSAGKATPIQNASLLKDEWVEMDRAVIRAEQERLVGYDSLISRGLTYDISTGMAITMLESQSMSTFTEAEISMNGLKRSNADAPDYDLVSIPLPIIHKDFSIDLRTLSTSRKMGMPLDLTSAEMAGRVIAEKKELLLFGSEPFYYGGSRLDTFKSYENKIIMNSTYGWLHSSKKPTDIFEDVRRMKQALIEQNRAGGPYLLYISGKYDTVLDKDYADSATQSGTGKTIKQRLMEIQGLEDIIVVDALKEEELLMVHAKSDTIRIVRALPTTTVEWEEEGGMALKYKSLSIEVPQIRSDYYGSSGIVHMGFTHK